ncbi:GEVED domain-containing protein [Lacinutrix jangbogonensis]|uniref:GEVED domain-containing protein n=1 Tax=Lacinutrix jangbogonensis TaxID=1469557 RepID=UPI00138E02F4|nr:GEVED domain-containing protein [Lacinutrix jangbogonensis]
MSFISLVLFFSIQLNSQNLSCGTPSMTENQIRYTLDVVDKAGAEGKNAGTTCLPIRIHIVTDDVGNGGVPMADVNEGVANLNNFYLVAGIEFYIHSVNSINSNALYTFDTTEETAMTAANSIYDAVNVYFVNSITVPGIGGACGYARFPNNNTSTLNMLMDNACLLNGPNGTFVHEFGHFFNLGHTHQSTGNGNTDPFAENVPRTGPNANCDTTGDLLCDTEADPNGSNDANCNFINDGVSTQDENGLTYTPDINNVMSYYSDACGGIFTPEQYTRIANGLATRLSHTAYNLLGAAPASVTNPSNLTASLNNLYGADLSWTDNATNELGYLIERSNDGGATWIVPVGAGVDANVTSYTDTTIVSNTTYDYRVKASNDSCNDYSATASIVVGLFYCGPLYFPSNVEPITLVDVAGISNVTDATIGGPEHEDFTLVVGAMEEGMSYPIALEGNTDGGFTNRFAVFIDWNQNGVLDDGGEVYEIIETIFNSTGTDGMQATGMIVVPAGVTAGNTIMRVKKIYNTTNYLNPCLGAGYGQAEDYTITVTASDGVGLSPKVYIQGAALNPNVGEEALMRDDLRVANLLPTTSPYTDGLSCDISVFNTTGTNAVVDWVYIELRSAASNTTIVDSQSALLLRNGAVVGVDGFSDLEFEQPHGDYYVAVKHRNHLGIMSDSTVSLSSTVTSVDFTDANNQITYGMNAQTTFGMPANIVALWSGDVNADKKVQYSGTSPDSSSILSHVLNDIGNVFNFPTFSVSGYNNNDVDMNGETQYAGTGPDTPFILQNVVSHSGNFLNFSTYTIEEQLPEN